MLTGTGSSIQEKMFRTANYVDNTCLRCGKTVYPTDKIGKAPSHFSYFFWCLRFLQPDKANNKGKRTRS